MVARQAHVVADGREARAFDFRVVRDGLDPADDVRADLLGDLSLGQLHGLLECDAAREVFCLGGACRQPVGDLESGVSFARHGGLRWSVDQQAAVDVQNHAGDVAREV